MLDEVGRWLENRSWSVADRPLGTLLAAKRTGSAPSKRVGAAPPVSVRPREGTSVSVVLPALNEEATVGEIVSVIRRELMSPAVPLVDELLVLDSGSTDRTAEVAAEAGARVVRRDEVLPRLPALPGKGEVLWRSLLATSGDIVCFVDADLRDFSADFVSGTVGPLLTDPELQLVKGMYERPLGDRPQDGGRVTELVARPLLNLHWPRLAGFVQPLGGEYAARRTLLERLPFPVGYGVELGLLVDALHTAGLNALGQVDLGARRHRHQDGQALGRMAATIYRTAQARLSRGPLVRPELVQFERVADAVGDSDAGTGSPGDEATGGGFRARTHAVDTEERPPMAEIPEYTARRRAA